jgi:hypothetical protein
MENFLKDLFWPLIAFASYILGGLMTFAGVAMILLMKGKDLWGWGEGHTLGYLFVCIGLILSILGVLVMRITRNRI